MSGADDGVIAAPDLPTGNGTIPDAAAPLPLDVTPADQDPPEPTAKGRRPRRGITEAQAAARRENGRKGGRPPKAVVNATQRAKRVEAMYLQVGGMLAMFGVLLSPRAAAVGTAMVEASPGLGTAWAEWADNSPAVARTIDALTTGGAAGAVLLAHAPIVAAAMAPAPAPADGDTAAGMPVGLADLLGGMAGASPA